MTVGHQGGLKLYFRKEWKDLTNQTKTFHNFRPILISLLITGVEGLPDDVEHNELWGRRKHPDPPKAYVDAGPTHVQQVILENCPRK